MLSHWVYNQIAAFEYRNNRREQMNKFFLMTLLACLATNAMAKERVYKWVDENGVTHYSPTPPPGENTDAEQLVVDSEDPLLPEPEPEPSLIDTPGLQAQAAPPDNSEIERRNRMRQCNHGRKVIEQVEPLPRVLRTEADGTVTALSDEERLRLLDEARAKIAKYCDQ